MRKNKTFITGCIILVTSCAPQRIDLTREERKLEKELQFELNCDNLEFRHDYEAITEKRNNGSFGVILCDTLCSLDSIELKKIALQLTPKITPVLNYKTNYKEITFYTSKEKHLSKKTSRLTCSKTFRVLLENPNNVIYLYNSF